MGASRADRTRPGGEVAAATRRRGDEGAAASTIDRVAELQGVAGNQAMIRLLSGSAGVDERSGGSPMVQRIAALGAHGPGGPLPFLDRIRASFGRHDVGHVRAFTGARASSAASALAARAYTQGSRVVFGRAPDLRTAAHEAAHVVQQRGGVRLKGEVGEIGDAHERHADAVADRVVAGRSAEDLLDRYAPPGSRPVGATPVIQRWGEPDHYMMGQLAGRKVVAALDQIETARERTYKLGDDEMDLTEDRDYEQSLVDRKKVIRVEAPSSEKLFLRGPDGAPMSLGAANRFAGDFVKKPIETESIHPSPSLDDMPSKIQEEHPKDLKEQKRIRMTEGDFEADHKFRVRKEYIDVGGFTEKTLMATNANHFFPLSTIEYRRQHAKALQKVWIATTLWKKAEAAEEEAAVALKKRANEAFRQATMIEGFAGHFLADCFAAGHLAPHALGRIGDKSLLKAGARVNTWHDLFNALPNGIPTSLGTFHGDYSMDGHDLEYVSSAIANSLLEVMMPWYAGVPFDGNVVTPVPDVAAIRRDPVAGPLWRTMCGDYEKFFESLQKSSGRRETKISLSKYVMYATSAGSAVSKDEIMPAIARHVFGGDEGLERTDIDQDVEGVRGKVHSIVDALHTVLTWKAGSQRATGLSQKYGLPPLKPDYKYKMSLRSAQLAKASPATNPRKALIAELEFWVKAWRDDLEVRDEVHAGEEALLEDVEALLPLKESVKDKQRGAWLYKIKAILAEFLRLDARYSISSPLAEPIDQVPQGPDVDHHPDSSSGSPVAAKESMIALVGDERGPLDAFTGACAALLADPRPEKDAEHRELYDLVLEAAAGLKEQLSAAYRAGMLVEDPNLDLHMAALRMASAHRRIQEAREAGLSLGITTRQETFRRDTIAALKLVLCVDFEITAERLLQTTGRSV